MPQLLAKQRAGVPGSRRLTGAGVQVHDTSTAAQASQRTDPGRVGKRVGKRTD